MDQIRTSQLEGRARGPAAHHAGREGRSPGGAAPVLQAKADHAGSLGALQRLSHHEDEPSAPTASAQRNPNRTGLPDQLKSGIESVSGVSMDSVRVHYNSPEPARIQAHAYAQGSDIHVAPGQEQHLPHEAWHVVQQAQGRVPVTSEVGGMPVNDNPSLEAEADRMGSQALQSKAVDDDLERTSTAPSQAVLQGAFTRGQAQAMLDHISERREYPSGWSDLSAHEQYIVLELARRKGVSLPQKDEDKLQEWDQIAEENSEVDHIGGNADEFGPDTLLYESVVQLKRGPGVSGPKSFSTSNLGAYKNVSYTRDGVGNVNFAGPSAQTAWTNPVKGNSEVDLEEGSKKSGFGITAGNTVVSIPSGSREQHFSIANRVAKKNGQTYSSTSSQSPDGWTWHHLLNKYKMVLVDRTVHQKYGHNGGFYFW